MGVFSTILGGRSAQCYEAIPVSGATDYTLSVDQSICGIIEFSGAITGNINTFFPAVAGDKGAWWVIYNNTTGSFTLTVKASSGTGVAIAQGFRALVMWDGTNFVALANDLVSVGAAKLGSNSTITALLGITGGITMSGGLNLAGALGGNSAGTAPLQLSRAATVIPTDANYTVLAAGYACPIQTVTSTGALTATRNLVLPIVDGAIFVIHNSTTGAQSIQAIGSSGTGVTIANGKTVIVYCDGTNYRRITADNP